MNKVVFIYRKGANGLGSVYLRGNQVADSLKLHGYECSVVPQGTAVRDSTIIFIKPATYNDVSMYMDNNRIFIDPLDDINFLKDLRTDQIKKLDVMFHCLDFLEMYKNKVKKAYHVPHHWDERLRELHIDNSSLTDCRIGTFGHKKPYIPESSKNLISRINISHMPILLNRWVNHLSQYNCHYILDQDSTPIIRTRPSFTKGAISAISNSVIITNKNKNALHFLGEDYPFYIEDTSDRGIINTLEYVKNNFGTPTWNNALDTMKIVKEQTDIKNIVKIYIDMLKS